MTGNPQSSDDMRQASPPPTDGSQLDGVDVALGILTLPVLLFVLMFATSSMTEMLKDRRRRRRFGLLMLVIEIAIVGFLVWVVVS